MPQLSRYIRPFVFLLAVLATQTDAQNIQPLTDRVDAIVAHPLVLPIKVQNPRSIKSDLRVRLDDGRTIRAKAYFVWASTIGSNTQWTRDTPLWNIQTPEQHSKSSASTQGTWIAMIDLPIDAVGQGIWINDLRYEPNWLPSPERVILETSSHASDGFWNPALSESQQQSPYVQHALSNLRADPFNRWRARMMAVGFNPQTSIAATPARSDRDLIAIHTELLQSDASLVLDQIADHFSARWQIILGRIWLINPQVAHRLKRQLTRTASAQGHIIPLWSNNTTQLSALAHDLLSPFVNDELRVERAVAWLDSQPDSMSWVIDDSGHPTRDSSNNQIHMSPTIGLLLINNQTNPHTDGLARIQSTGINIHVKSLPAGEFTRTTFSAPVPSHSKNAQLIEPREVFVKIGSQRTTHRIQGGVPQASPPGILVGPLLADWTLTAFGSGQSGLGALPPPDRRVAGLLHRTAGLDQTNPRVGWRLYLECAIDPSHPNDPASNPTIKISIGPMGSTRASWTISRSYGLTEMRTDPDITPDPSFVQISLQDRWIIQLDIPPESISQEGLLSMGIERIDQNAHSSWPRRMLPWQSEPGRFTIDTHNWTGTDQSP